MPQESLDLPARVLVTGAAGGIGAALVSRLLKAGVAVIATDLTGQPAALGSQPGTLRWIRADLGQRAGREALAEALTGTHAELIGGFVHVAGILDPAQWDAIDEAQVEHLFAVNLNAPFFLVRALLPVFTADASVVLMGSIAGLRASPRTPFYAASKAALRNLGASMAVAFQPRGIRVNVVAPGLIDTPLTDGLNKALAIERGVPVAQIESERALPIPAGRPGTPDEVASACLFLLSRQASYCSGITLHPTGGVMAGAI
jgi:NAD(P)-dependent dehydrogenase (short-subunit alcohol dehydrogenase family)